MKSYNKSYLPFHMFLVGFVSCNGKKKQVCEETLGFFCLTLTFSILHCTEESFLSLVKSCGFVGCYWLAFFVSVFLLCGFLHWLSLYWSMLDVVSLVGQHVISPSL